MVTTKNKNVLLVILELCGGLSDVLLSLMVLLWEDSQWYLSQGLRTSVPGSR